MINHFKLNNEDLKAYRDDLNKIVELTTNLFNYQDYKYFWNLPEKNNISVFDIERVLLLLKPAYVTYAGEVDLNDLNIYDNFYDYLFNCIKNILNVYHAKEIDTYDSNYPSNPYHLGYELIDGNNVLSFYTNYTGVAGAFWETMGGFVEVIELKNGDNKNE